ERSACAYARAIAESVGSENVLFVITDRADVTCRSWLPADIRVVNLLETCETLTGEERCIVLLNLLSACRPTAVIGFNSLTFWNMVDCHAPIWRNELPSRFVGYLGGYETFTRMNDWGFVDGAMRRVASMFDLFISENQRMRDTMIEQYADVPGIRQKVFCCFKSLTPELSTDLALPAVAAAPSEQAGAPPVPAKAKVLWAAR